MLNTVALDIVCNIYINISSKDQHNGKELKCIQSKSVILVMQLNYSYMDRLYAQWGQCGFFGYQDCQASIPAVCFFKVRCPEQLDFIVRSGKILDLKVYYNRPTELENFKYVDFLKTYNISSTLPRFYQNNTNNC